MKSFYVAFDEHVFVFEAPTLKEARDAAYAYLRYRFGWSGPIQDGGAS